MAAGVEWEGRDGREGRVGGKFQVVELDLHRSKEIIMLTITLHQTESKKDELYWT